MVIRLIDLPAAVITGLLKASDQSPRLEAQSPQLSPSPDLQPACARRPQPQPSPIERELRCALSVDRDDFVIGKEPGFGSPSLGHLRLYVLHVAGTGCHLLAVHRRPASGQLLSIPGTTRWHTTCTRGYVRRHVAVNSCRVRTASGSTREALARLMRRRRGGQ